jgi:hypothetical protein
VKRCPLYAMFNGLIHVAYSRDAMPQYKRTLCDFVLQDVHPYVWTPEVPTCLECIERDEWTV